MISKKEKYILRDSLRRSHSLKLLYVNFLKKSLVKNLFLKKNIRLYITVSLGKNPNLKKVKNICMLSGENSAVRKNFLISRFKLNSLSIQNNLENFRLNSW
jgi:ribosomal protein S14